MNIRLRACRAMIIVAAINLLVAGNVCGAEIRVMNSGGFSAAYRILAQEFERLSGHHLLTSWGASMGETPDAIPVRLKRREQADVLIMVGSALDRLIEQGSVSCDIRVDLARSGIGMAVRKGASRPDISTVDAFKRTLLAAQSIAYSDSASGVYLSTVLFQRLGIADTVLKKSRKIEGEPVGNVVARGEAELGFQQISELLPVQGIDLVVPLPMEIQKITLFSACSSTSAKYPNAAQALVKYLAAPSAAAAILKSGMEPLAVR